MLEKPPDPKVASKNSDIIKPIYEFDQNLTKPIHPVLKALRVSATRRPQRSDTYPVMGSAVKVPKVLMVPINDLLHSSQARSNCKRKNTNV